MIEPSSNPRDSTSDLTKHQNPLTCLFNLSINAQRTFIDIDRSKSVIPKVRCPIL